MDPLSVGTGAITILDACLKLGKALVGIYNDYHLVETRAVETLLKLKALWYKTEMQMNILQKIWSRLDQSYQQNQLLLLSILENKLQQAINLLSRVIGAKSEPTTSSSLTRLLAKKGPLKKVEYFVLIHSSLENILRDFVEWHNLFDPSWYLLARIPGDEIDRNIESQASKNEVVVVLSGLRKAARDLNSAPNLPSRTISSHDFLGERSPIAASCATTAQIEGTVRYAVVDSMLLNSGADTTGTSTNVIALSKALARMEPFTFGLLRCCGVIKKPDKYDLVFEIPQGLHLPRSLRDWLVTYHPSLNVKLDIAKQVAKSVLYLHTMGFVHKNIRPETILDDTFFLSDSIPERDLYRHPSRQVNNPARRYIMQHDIYSLSVCMLEIGLWKSFVMADGRGKVVCDISPFGIDQKDHKDPKKQAFALKKQLLVTADRQLAQHTGERFKDVVEKCLTCLDEDSAWSRADDLQEKSGIDTGLEFIENVLLQLQEIVI